MNDLGVPLPDVLHEQDGDIRVRGHRISLYHIVTAYNERWIGPHSMVFHYPTLSLHEIEKVLAFYHANVAAVDEYVAAWKAEAARLEATLPKGPSKAELLARLEARQRDQAAATGSG